MNILADHHLMDMWLVINITTASFSKPFTVEAESVHSSATWCHQPKL